MKRHLIQSQLRYNRRLQVLYIYLHGSEITTQQDDWKILQIISFPQQSPKSFSRKY